MSSRRQFLRFATFVGASRLVLPRLRAQTVASSATLRYSNKALATMPTDFTGLSYESAQLYDPNFFSAANTQLVKLFRELTPSGVLRLGGDLSDVSRWKSEAGDFDTPKQAAALERGKQYWEWKLTDATVRANRDGAITPGAIRNLRAFLDATNWRLIYGLNFGSGSPERAADEAACVSREMGERLIAFQLGNEADFYGGNPYFRQKPFDFEQYWEGYRQFTEAVRQRVPQARFAGPDVANNMGWVQQFAEAQASEPASHKAVLLTGHYYAMGPAKDPAMNAERLLAPNKGLEEQIQKVAQARAAAGGLGYRMAEGNSCYGGGKPGVSNGFCAALWGADFMLRLGAAGYAGVNLHSGGDGYYTPVESLDATTSTARPIYFGMQLAQLFAGYEFAASDLHTEANINAYVARGYKTLQIALLNKGGGEAVVRGLPGKKPVRAWTLAAPELGSLTGVRFGPVEVHGQSSVTLPPYSAQVYRWTR